MNTKKCALCGETKEIEEFTINRVVKSGYSNRCKKCNNAKTYISIKKKQSFYTKKVNDYRKTPEGKIKTSARQKVKTALRSGKLLKQPCEICGDIKVQAHHKDYLKPLQVNWLCRSHHAERHQNLNISHTTR